MALAHSRARGGVAWSGAGGGRGFGLWWFGVVLVTGGVLGLWWFGGAGEGRWIWGGAMG